MRNPCMEQLESRLLLSAGVLQIGEAALFDLDANGSNDAVLVNTGSTQISYGYTAGQGLDYVNISADGGAFVTNTFVASVDDTSAADDFVLTSATLSKRVCYGGHRYDAIAGASNVQAGQINGLRIGKGDLLSAATTEGGIGDIVLCRGDLYDVYSEAGIGDIFVRGDVYGSVYAAGDISSLVADTIDGAAVIAEGSLGQICADAITGGAYVQATSIDRLNADRIDGGTTILTIEDLGRLSAGVVESANIIVGTDLGRVCVNELSGSEDGTTLSVGGALGSLWARTITGGVNGMLDISVGAGVGRIDVGLLEGGQAVDGGYAGTTLSVYGGIDELRAGMISGGDSTGPGSFAMLSISIDDLLGDDGDLGYLRASVLSGGFASDGGDAMLFLNISHDLDCARVGQIIGSGRTEVINDPSVFITVGNTIHTLTATEITAGTATGDYAFASVFITAGWDIERLVAGRIDAGTANGDYAEVMVQITAGNDIGLISARTISGGMSNGAGAMAGLYVEAGNNIDMIAAGLISGTRSNRPIADPTVQFLAGNNIGTVMAGTITGGNVTSDGTQPAEGSVKFRAENDIERIYAGTIRGGTATGADALSYVDISAGHDIGKVVADRISGGRTADGGESYVNIVAEHDILALHAGTIIGSENGSTGSDPAVQIQAYNDIKLLTANRIIAGNDGTVNILAGLDANGDVSGDGEAGSIEKAVIGMISGSGGIVNIAAGGDIDLLKVCRVRSGNGEVNVIAGEDMTVDVRRVRSWAVDGETGVEFSAGGSVNDVRNRINDRYETEGETVTFPTPIS